MLVFENVPGIVSRGAEVLIKVRQLLTTYGYVFHESTHDCGEIGGLAQHRKRYLMVARRPSVVPGFVYQPPKRRVRACGEVLAELPIPGISTEGGPLHELPKLSWLNWVRLALIPAGGDWRDLPSAVTLEQTAKGAESFKGRPGLFGVQEWEEPSSAITGTMKVSGGNGSSAVADPRLEHAPRRDSFGVGKWGEPAKSVRGRSDIRTGEAAVSDPRLQHTPRPGSMGVLDWDKPAKSITGAIGATQSNVPGSVADPRPFDGGRMGVQRWEDPAKTVVGESYPSNGSASVADPRIPSAASMGLQSDFARTGQGSRLLKVVDPDLFAKKSPRHSTKYRIEDWKKPAHTITGGDARVGSGAPSVADPRTMQGFLDSLEPGELTTPLKPGQERRQVFAKFDNRPWTEPARTVAGSGSNGGYAVSDPRPSEIGTNHRKGRHPNQYKIGRWEDPARTVTGDTDIQEGAQSIADVRLNRPGRNGFYGVISWQEALGAVTGHANIDNGAFAVADPRKPHVGRVPIIIAADGSWHRPLTTLELAALQGLPMILDGKPLELAGKTVSGFRERIGNAVPVGAGKAIALSILKALLAGSLGTWFLSMTDEPIWVRRRDGYPDLAEVTV